MGLLRLLVPLLLAGAAGLEANSSSFRLNRSSNVSASGREAPKSEVSGPAGPPAKPTAQQLDAALEVVISHLSSSEAALVREYKGTVLGHLQHGTEPAPGHPLRKVLEHSNESLAAHRAAQRAAMHSPCAKAGAKVAVGCASFVFRLVGISMGNEEQVAGKVLDTMGEEKLSLLSPLFHRFTEAKDNMERAGVVLELLMKMDVSVIADAAYEAMSGLSTWEKTRSILTLFAHLGLWFGTQGVAFAAQCAILLLHVPQLIMDVSSACRVCGYCS